MEKQPDGKVGNALQYVDRSRTDGVSTDGPASLGHQRRVGKKVSSYGYQGLSNPTPGSKLTGAEKAQRDYFRECVAKGGKMED
jgi:hypothetical protein